MFYFLDDEWMKNSSMWFNECHLYNIKFQTRNNKTFKFVKKLRKPEISCINMWHVLWSVNWYFGNDALMNYKSCFEQAIKSVFNYVIWSKRAFKLLYTDNKKYHYHICKKQ